MAKITKVYQRRFGSAAGANQVAKFGSLAAGFPARYDGTANPATIMSLSNWLDGWFGAVVGANSPPIEDVNAAFFVAFYQLAYLMQAGIAEWDAETIYYIGSLANDGFGNLYVSKTDNNVNNALSSVANWQIQGGVTSTKTANYTATGADDVILADTSGGAFTITLPAAASLSGKKITIKKVSADGNTLTIDRSGSNLIDGETAQTYVAPMTSVTWGSDGVSNWYGF